MKQKHISYGAYFKHNDEKYWLSIVDGIWVFIPHRIEDNGEFFEDKKELRDLLYSFGNMDVVMVKRVETIDVTFEDYVTLEIRENNDNKKTKHNT